jgi:hypothetical protein
MDSNSLKNQLNAAVQRRDLLQNQRNAIDIELRQLNELIPQLNRSIANAQSAENQEQNVRSYSTRGTSGNPNPLI